MSEINPLTKDQLFEKKIAENTGSDYNVGDIFDVVPVTKDQSFLKEIALNSAGQSEAIEAIQDMISDAYDPTATYDVGDYCIHNDILYKCNTAIATGEAFTPAKWDASKVSDELKTNTTAINGKINFINFTLGANDEVTFHVNTNFIALIYIAHVYTDIAGLYTMAGGHTAGSPLGVIKASAAVDSITKTTANQVKIKVNQAAFIMVLGAERI